MQVLASAVQLLLLLLLTTTSGVLCQSSNSMPMLSGSVEGQVTLAEKPMPGVTVILIPRVGQRSEPIARSVTDGEGRFKFDGVAPGNYLVDAFTPAFVAVGASLSNSSRGKAVTVSENEAATGVEISLTRGGVITGRIEDSKRQPLINMPVDLRQVDQSGRPLPRRITSSDQFMYRTDDRGVYRIYGLPPGRYKVSVGIPTGAGAIQHPGGYYPLTFYPDVTEASEARIIELQEGGEISNVDIRVGSYERTYNVSGQIIDGDTGKVMAGLLYGYGATSDAGQFIGTPAIIGTRSSPEGEFHIAGLPSGRYAAHVINEGNSEFYCDPTVFEVMNSDVNGIQIRMKRGASISGTIVFEGTDDTTALDSITKLKLNVTIIPSTLEAFRRDFGQITPDGRFSIVGLRPGKATISVYGSIGGKNVTLSRIEHESPEQEAIQLQPGEQVTGVRLILKY